MSGVTRAKQHFTMIADRSQIARLSQGKSNDLLELMQYVGKQGKTQISARESQLFQSKGEELQIFQYRGGRGIFKDSAAHQIGLRPDSG